MLERQHLTVKDYNKDQKAYASMLNKMYVAAKEGEFHNNLKPEKERSLFQGGHVAGTN